MKQKKRSSKNLKISTRITLTTILGIVIPLVIVATFSSLFLSMMANYFNFATVTTKSYSVLNQIQWSQTISAISEELINDKDNDEKLTQIKKLTTALENVGTNIYIENEGDVIYSSNATTKDDIIKQARSIVKTDTDINQNYFGENGVVIVSHAESKTSKYLMIITSNDYEVNDFTAVSTIQSITSIMLGKTGIILIAIVLVFIISIVVLSLITSQTIIQPLKKLSVGANEIANGNLDYVIDYESTNELGITVDSFNRMAERLKVSIEEQKRIEQSRKEMTAGLAHDLRTPLTSIKGYVEGLKDGIADTPQKQQRYLDTIYSSAKDMEKLLDELLNISRLELGKIELNAEVININDVLYDCANEITIESEKSDFQFEYHNYCDDDTFVNLDTDRFSRVVKNIISNSIKYKSPKRKCKITLEAKSYRKSVIISISDNGIGLNAADTAKIFDTFYRADKARTNVRDGSGIGLAVCKQIVELHGGKIWATGKEDEGLKILISLEKIREENSDEKANTDC